jgi:hypothetical protein
MNLFLLQAPNSVLGTKIVLNKQSDLILHGAEIVAPTGIVEADIDGLVSHFTQIEQTISDSGSQLNSGIDNEASIRLAADQSLAADLAAEKGRIDVILDGSTVDLDQFREVVDFVQSIDLENDESLLNAVVNINQNIDNVIGDFESADSDILDQLSTLTIYTENQVDILTSGLEQEIQDRTQAVQGVQDDLNNYKDYTDTTIINLQNNISMGDESLATSLSSEESSRISGDESLATLLTNSLDQNYSQLSSDISAEVSRATSAEESLNTKVDFVISNTDPAALDSLSEIVAAFTAADGDINNAITNLANAATTDLSTEVSRATSAEASLASDLSSAVSTEESARLAAVSTEESARLAADASLAADLSSEVSTANYRITYEANKANDGLNALAVAMLSADASLEVALSTEVSYLLANTDLGSIDSFAEVSDTLAAEISRSESVEDTKLDLAGGTMTGSINMDGNTINNAGAVYTNNLLSSLNTEIIVLNDLALGAGAKVSGLPAPTAAGDAANKLYVDSAASTLTSDLSTEVSRAEEAESSLAVAAENFVYNVMPSFQEVTGSIDGSNKTFTAPCVDTTGIVFLNGLLQREGRDYQTLATLSGFAFSFINAPQIGDVVDVYGCPIGVSF